MDGLCGKCFGSVCNVSESGRSNALYSVSADEMNKMIGMLFICLADVLFEIQDMADGVLGVIAKPVDWTRVK